MKSIKPDTKGAVSIAPAVHNADVNGASVDLLGFEGALVLVAVGSYTDGTLPVQIEEADDDGTGSPSTFAAVADADLDGTHPSIDAAGDADTVFRIGYLGSKRHLRVVLSGSTPGATGAEVAAIVVRHDPQYGPVS